MKSPKKWRVLVAGAAVAVAVPVVISSTSSAAPSGNGQGKSSDWVGSWAAAVTAADPGSSQAGFNNQSYRNIVHLSVGGDQFRVRLSNLYGTQSVNVGHATVALPDKSTPAQSDIIPSSLHQLTFNGSSSTTMQQGDDVFSDPVNWSIPDQSDLVVTVYFPTPTGPATWHVTTKQDNFRGAGDLANSANGPWDLNRVCCWFFLSGIDVLRHKPDGAIVVLGDSISDGNGSTQNANTKWPDFLANRLIESRHKNAPAVLNMGISGNRLLHEGIEDAVDGFTGGNQFGPHAGARLQEDVFSQTGVSTVVIQLGINDIWMKGDSAASIIEALKKLNTQLQEHGLTVIVSTIMPDNGLQDSFSLPHAWSPEKEATRQAVNAFIRSADNDFDGVADFDQVLRDPSDPTKVKAAYDSGDHIHPNNAGAEAMADAFPIGFVK